MSAPCVAQGSPRRALRALACCCLGLLYSAGFASAQDERRILSPNGQLEFRLFISQPGSGGLPQLAYQVRRNGSVVIDTSFLGLSIHNQEPLLGENDGLVASRAGEESGRYRWLAAEYMQNGSLGRRINIEARVWDNAVAFRYLIPRSTPLDEILIDDDLTEFAVAGRGHVNAVTLPAALSAPDGGWIGVAEIPIPGFPRASLSRTADGFPRAHLPLSASNPLLAFEGRTPLVCPWRVLTFAADREQALHPAVASELTSQ